MLTVGFLTFLIVVDLIHPWFKGYLHKIPRMQFLLKCLREKDRLLYSHTNMYGQDCFYIVDKKGVFLLVWNVSSTHKFFEFYRYEERPTNELMVMGVAHTYYGSGFPTVTHCLEFYLYKKVKFHVAYRCDTIQPVMASEVEQAYTLWYRSERRRRIIRNI